MARRYPKTHKRTCPHGHNLDKIRTKYADNKSGEDGASIDKYDALWCKRCEKMYVLKNDNDFYYKQEE